MRSSKRRQPTVTGAHASIPKPHVTITTKDDSATVVVTEAYGPSGDNLVGLSDVTFDGHPAIAVGIRAEGKEGLLHLSPIHGDNRKEGITDFERGSVCEMLCPVSGRSLDRLADTPVVNGTDYFILYLNKSRDEGSMIVLSNVWGHFHSRVVDHFELISSWLETE
jgi:hypothetical protein